MTWHLFWMYGMWGPATDAGSRAFVSRVKSELRINCHDSPYRDYEAGNIAAMIDRLPPNHGVFVGGTSLGSNDVPVVCNYVKQRTIDGAFGFQASMYGAKGWRLNENVKFAHLIYSFNPLALGLGAYRWPLGTMNPKNYHLTPHHLPHPGDGDVGDQSKFIAEMKVIMLRENKDV